MMGTLGQKCFTSGVHFSGMFSRESGESVEDMKMNEVLRPIVSSDVARSPRIT